MCRPLIDWLGLKSKQIITEEFLEKGIQVAINTSYQVASKLTKSLTGENLSSRTIRTGMIKKSVEIKQDQANASPKEYKVILKMQQNVIQETKKEEFLMCQNSL